MLLFRRILGFTQETIREKEQRHAQRHTVSVDFPLKVVLNAHGRDDDDQKTVSRDGRGRNWGAQAVNLSANGASLRVPLALALKRGDQCNVTLSIEGHVFVLRGTVAHYRACRDYAAVGLAVETPDLAMRRGYLQLLETLAIGESLRPVAPRHVRQDSNSQHKEQYQGDAAALLTVWRTRAGGELQAFEFQLGGFFARGSAGNGALQVFALEDSSAPRSNYAPVTLKPSPTHAREIQSLFRWVRPHLTTAIPADVRSFLAGFAA